jgi:hypothetical protein
MPGQTVFRAEPNPIVLNDFGANILDTPTGTAELSWCVDGVDEVEVHVGSPSGALFARTGPGTHSKSADWIVDGMTFYLQDVSHSQPLSSEHTLATVQVSVAIGEELRTRHRLLLEENLILLHDTLEAGPLAGRYWVLGGLLLGWAREGRILTHDLQDGDFGFFREDHDKLRASVSHLSEAGFKPLHRLRTNEGDPVMYAFEKDWATFEFMEHERLGQNFRLWSFGARIEGEEAVMVEMVCQVPRFELAPMEFLGRTWQKPDDHDAHLTAMYGDWKTPNHRYDFMRDDLSIVETHPWTGSFERAEAQDPNSFGGLVT